MLNSFGKFYKTLFRCFSVSSVKFTVVMLLKRIPDVSQLNVGI